MSNVTTVTTVRTEPTEARPDLARAPGIPIAGPGTGTPDANATHTETVVVVEQPVAVPIAVPVATEAADAPQGVVVPARHLVAGVKAG